MDSSSTPIICCKPAPDITIEHIGDILTFDLAALLGSKTTSSTR